MTDEPESVHRATNQFGVEKPQRETVRPKACMPKLAVKAEGLSTEG